VAAPDSAADLATETTPSPKRGDLYDTRAPSARPLFHDFPAVSRIIALTITCRLRCELSKLIAGIITLAGGFPRRMKKDAKKRGIKRGDRVFASGCADESVTGDNERASINLLRDRFVSARVEERQPVSFRSERTHAKCMQKDSADEQYGIVARATAGLSSPNFIPRVITGISRVSVFERAMISAASHGTRAA